MSEEWSHPVFATREEFEKRLAEVILEEQEGGRGWWYLSFATEEEFLGGLYLEASGPVEACMIAGLLGLNPGGEVLAWPVTPEKLEQFAQNVPDEKRYRLLTKEEVDS